MVSKRGKESYYNAELWLKGELLAENGKQNDKEAERCFLAALDIARQQGAESPELRTTMSLYRLWQRMAKQKGAKKNLSVIYNWFSEGFHSPDPRKARELLSDLT